MASQNKMFAGMFADEKLELSEPPLESCEETPPANDGPTAARNERLQEAMDAFREAGRLSAAAFVSKLPDRLRDPLSVCFCAAPNCLRCAERATVASVDRQLASLRRR